MSNKEDKYVSDPIFLMYTKHQKEDEKVVAVRVEGKFAEFFSPFYKEPYEDNDEFREFYNKKILPIQPVVGPCLGDGDDEYLVNDLTCLAERLACDCDGSDVIAGWVENRDTLMDAVDKVFRSGEPYTVVVGNREFTITPYRRKELPPINENHLKVFGKFADLIRERVAAI